jgi:RNA polymerase sigma-70 factor (ECF subfamily)
MLFAPDAIAYTDGGGRVTAALNPIYGAEKVVRFVVGVASKLELGSSLRWTATEINGRPAMISIAEGDPMTAITIESDGERITAIYVQRNPDKLVRLSQALGMSIISS